MSRRHQKPPLKISKPTFRPEGERGLGLKAFHVGNYGEAIRLWSELDAEDPAVRAALAEAHFRRALAARQSFSEAEADLRRAADLLPEVARTWYQLGMTLHRNDRLEEARQAYARAAERGLARRGFGIVRGLAELEADPNLSLETLPWLSAEARAALEPIAALLRGAPAGQAKAPVPAVASEAPASGVGPKAPASGGQAEALSAAARPPIPADPVAALWQGLRLLAQGEAEAAYTALGPPRGQRLPVGAEPTRAFYQGVAAALAGKPQMALSVWRELTRLSPLASSSCPPRLKAALSQLSTHSILALQQEGRWEEALQQAQTGAAHAPADLWMPRAALIAANRLATAARETGNWRGVVARLYLMRSLLEQHPTLGPLPPVLHNLAIAFEALQEWEEAAQTWAALLNTLPRRSGRPPKNPVPAPAGPSLEEQRAWMRRRILDNYGRAELPDEAIAYYKQAVKADPDNLALRLEMAAALLANDQSIAARNEVQRILDKDPKQTAALLFLAEIHQTRGEIYAAEIALSRLLEIDPQHDTARKAIRQMILERGMYAFNSRQFPQALEIYTRALTYAPDDPQLLVFLGQTENVLGRARQAQAHFDAALAVGTVDAYGVLFVFWVRMDNEPKARQVLERAEAAGKDTLEFYMRVGVACLTLAERPAPARTGRKPAPPSVWETWGPELIGKGLDRAPDRADALERLLPALGPQHPALAVEYARQLVALQPDDPEHHLDLALYQGFAKDVAGAKATLAQAERLARKQGRKDLLDPIAELRREVGSPLFGKLGAFFGPGGRNPFDLEEDL